MVIIIYAGILLAGGHKSGKSVVLDLYGLLCMYICWTISSCFGNSSITHTNVVQSQL